MLLFLQKSDGHAGHAMLHDFCMTIPYGGIALVSGLVAFVFKATTAGMQLSGAGAVISLCSVLSLKTWKTGGSSTPYTLLSGGKQLVCHRHHLCWLESRS